MLSDFQICISVPLSLGNLLDYFHEYLRILSKHLISRFSDFHFLFLLSVNWLKAFLKVLLTLFILRLNEFS